MKIFIATIMFAIISFISYAQTIPYNKQFLVNSDTSGDQINPKICALNGNGFIICWENWKKDSGSIYYRSSIYGQMYDANFLKRGDAFRVNTNAIRVQKNLNITPLPDGGFVVCWICETSYPDPQISPAIYFQIFDKNGLARGPEHQIQTESSFYQSRPCISSWSDSGFVICWDAYPTDYTTDLIFGQTFNYNGEKRGLEFIVDRINETDRYTSSCVNTLANGDFIVCWQGFDGGLSNVFAQIFNHNGIKKSSSFIVSETHSEKPSIAVLEDHNIIICWSTIRDERYIYGQLYNQSGDPLNSEFNIGTDYDPDGWTYDRGPVVCDLANGGFLVSWVSLGRIFSNNYVASESAFQIASKFLSIDCLNDDKIIVCWQSGDGDGYGIYCKYYSLDPIIHQLHAYSLDQPSNDSTLKQLSVTLKWQHASDIHTNFPWEIKYYIYLDDNPNFSNPTLKTTISDTSYNLYGLLAGHTYFWKILVKNIAGDSLWSNEAFGFFVSYDIPSDIEEQKDKTIYTFVTTNNYPNPFNSVTTIAYQLSKPTFLNLSIFDITGKLIKTLVNNYQDAGNYSVKWYAENVGSGIYVYRIKAGKIECVQKMILLK